MGKQVVLAPLPLKVKFAKEIGTRIYLRRYWGEKCAGGMGCHNAMFKLQDMLHPLILGDREHHGGRPEDYADDLWPKVCEDCGEPVPSTATRQIFNHRLYDTPSGRPERGSIWWAHWMPVNWEWDNKTDYFLYAMCPDGSEWNIDGRASNCGMKNDRSHRCWVRHGDPETGNIHVDKAGVTCNAGAGSIQTPSWHGFLHNGFFDYK